MNTKVLKRVSLCLMFLMLIVGINIYAASLTGSSNVYVGDTVTVTFNFGQNVGAYDNLTVSYDTNMLEYVSGDSLKEDVWWDSSEASNGISTKTYTFRAKNAGTSRVVVVANGVTSADANMTSLGTVTAEKMINISQKNENKAEDKPNKTENTNGNVNSGSKTASGNNYLKYLQISEEGLTPNFTRNVTDYAISVGENVTSIDVLAKAEDANARVEITGNTNLVDGDNTINIKVTAENGYYRIYSIVVTKSADKEKSNAYLEELIVEGFSLDRDFQSESLEYNIGEISSTVKYLNVVATTKDKNAKLEIIGADKLVESGDGEVIIKVIAPDGTTTKEYKIKYTVKEATQEEVLQKEMKDYLKDIQDGKTKKEIAIAYLKYIWAAIKKNYLLVIMYLVVIIEFIIILATKKSKKKNDDGPDDNRPDKTILKVEPKKEEPKLNDSNIQNSVTIEPPKVEFLDEVKPDETDTQRIGRRGSLEKGYRAEEVEQSGIKLVDLDKNEGPKDELTFNIFENLNDDDIKRMLEEQIDKDDN